MALIENIQREDLNVIEEAQALRTSTARVLFDPPAGGGCDW